MHTYWDTVPEADSYPTVPAELDQFPSDKDHALMADATRRHSKMAISSLYERRESSGMCLRTRFGSVLQNRLTESTCSAGDPSMSVISPVISCAQQAGMKSTCSVKGRGLMWVDGMRWGEARSANLALLQHDLHTVLEGMLEAWEGGEVGLRLDDLGKRP